MLKIYDQNKNPAGYISKYKDICVESDLETGDKTLSFTYCARKAKNIQNEYYIETKDDRYVVKETGISSDGFPEYQCKLDLEDLESYMHSSFSSEKGSLLDAARLAVAGTGWTVKSEVAADKIRKVAVLKATPYTILGKIKDAWMCEMSFDSKNKVVCFSEKIGKDKGVYFVSGLNLNKIKYTEDTYDFYTRIIPIGKDGLKITDINGGKEYVENYQYSSKVRTLIWEDTNYEDAAAMKEDATAKLNDLSKPKKSYSVEVFDLAKQNQKYSLLEYSLGDTILLLDEKTGTREKQRIVKMKEYPQTPKKNTCELSNTVLSWEEYQAKLEAAASAFENITNADGTVKGVLVRGVEAEGVVGIEVTINNSSSVKDIKSQVSSLGDSVSSINDEVSLVKARIGTVEATYIKVTEADIKYATLEKANILEAKIESIDGDYAKFKSTVTDELSAHTATIDNLNGDYADFKSATITDLSAVKARIDTVVANNITTENLKAKVAELGYLSAESAKLQYAQIDFANVTGQVVGTSLIKDGAITDAKILSLSASKLTAGIIDAAKITVTNLNADNITVGKINGKLIGTGTVDLDKLSEEVPTKEYLDSVQDELQDQIDQSIQTYSVTTIPLLSNAPAKDWAASDYDKHIGDICYVINPGGQSDGYTYRFEKSGNTYAWTLIKDSQVTEALQKLIDVDGDLSGLKSFQSETNSWTSKTDSELSSIKSRTTTIETTYSTKAEAQSMADKAKNDAQKYADDVVEDIEQTLSTKVETTTFNEVKQTVDSNTAQITKMGKTLEQKADGSTVESLSQAVNLVQQTADSNSARITQMGKTLEQKADGNIVESLTERTSSVEQTVGKLSANFVGLKESVEQKADGSTVTELEKKYSNLETGLDGFKSEVGNTYVKSDTYGTDKKDLEDAITNVSDKLKDYVLTSTYETYVGQTDKAIELRAKQTEVDAITQRLSTAESTISQLPDNIELIVTEDGIISAINQTAESIKINASKIDLSGYVTIASLKGNGTTTIDGSNIKTGTISADRLDVNSIFAKNITATGTITGVTLNGATGSFSGTITSGAGKIGGWNIGSGSISYSTDTHTVTMAPMTNANGDFLTVHDKANNTYPFFVRADGFHAYRGVIGGFTISGSSIYKGTSSIDSGTAGVYIGTDGISNVGSYGSTKIRDGHIELGSLILNYGNGISIYDFDSNPNSIYHFQINKNGYAYFREIHSYYNWLGTQNTGWYEVTNDQAGRLYCRYKENASGEYKYTNIAYIMSALSGKAASSHTHNGVFVNTSVGYSGSKGSLYKTWKDNAAHDIIVAADDGLNTYVGWAGSSTYKTSVNLRGQSIKCNGSTSWSSDRNLKHAIHDINDPYERFFYLLRPVTYQYDLGGSGRHHIGYIAQEVEQSLQESGLTAQDFAGFVRFELNRETETDENGYERDIENSESNYLLDKGFHQQCNLAYTEFIALNTHMIQKQHKYIQELQNDYNFMKQQLQNAFAQIQAMQETINRLEMAN